MQTAQTLSSIANQPGFAFAWIGLWAGGSALYRLTRGKPLFPRKPKNALYSESFASGHSNRNLLTRFGGAQRCLIVAVTPDNLVIRPWFPFNLFFMPEIYDLEHTIPRKNIRAVRTKKFLFRRRVIIEFVTTDREPSSVTLWLRNADGFLRALEADSPASRGAIPSTI